ncbi:MAG: DUF6356 family protein [Gammaproteobacteria bacterium]
MNIFTDHPQQQGVSYFEHMEFALGIAMRLLNSVVAFSLHAFFPFIDIKKSLDLEETARFINEQNDWIECMKKNKETIPGQLQNLQNRKIF